MSAEVFEVVFPLWLRAFSFTLVVEVPLFVLLAKKALWSSRNIPIWRLVLAGGLGTCFTHPLLWFVWPLLITDYTIYIISGEFIVAAVESCTFYIIARPIRFHHAIIAAFVANAASYFFGLFMST